MFSKLKSLFSRSRPSSIPDSFFENWQKDHSIPLHPTAIKVALRSLVEVQRRTLIVSGITHAGFGCDRKRVVDWLQSENLWNRVTDWERHFLTSQDLLPSEISRASWGIERLWMLAWVLQLVEEIDHQIPCGSNLGSLVPGPDHKTDDFYQSTKLRDSREILTQSETLKAYLQILSKKSSQVSKYEPGILLERYYVIEWLTSDLQWGENVPVK